MTIYVTNLCTNPSFEVNLGGWTALTDTSIVQDGTFAQYGTEAMLVTTDGLVSGEGFTGPVVTNGASPATGAVSLSFLSQGSGTLTFEAIDASTMAILGSTTVNLDGTGGWDQRVAVTFSLSANETFQLVVTTPSVQALTFWVDGCQYETGVSSASAYIDGDQPGCVWTGTAGLSTSELLYPNATSASGGITLTGYATPIGIGGQQFFTSASGTIHMSGDAAPENNAVPAAAFTDFSIFGLTDLDPAMTYADQNNAGMTSGSGSYAQSYGIFYPPLDYVVSQGQYAWKRAAYMGIGFYYTGVPSLNEEILTNMQVTLAPVGTTTPVTYTPPRQVATIIKPTRLNFCTNPAFAVSASGWSGTGTGTVATDSTILPTPAYATEVEVGNLSSYFNSSGISNDGTTGTANLDGFQTTYSAQALAAAGYGFGASVTANGISYIMPSAAPGTPDCISCLGQTIPVAGIRGAGVIGFLGATAGTVGTGASGTITVTYTDGSTTTATLGLSDWTLNAGANTPGFGNQIAASMSYRNDAANGTTQTEAVYLFTQTVSVNSGKTVATVTLPNSLHMHIFGMSLASANNNTYTGNSGKATMNASGDGIEIAVPDLVVGDIYTVSFLVQAGADLTAITASCGNPVPGIAGSGSVTITGSNIETGVWFTPSFSFVATSSSSSELLKISATGAGGATYPLDFWVNAVLIEEGEVVGTYFDGSFGSTKYLDYQWESTAGLSRSYYYQQLTVKQYSVEQILEQHIPLGLSAPSPEYLTVYTQ